MTLSISWEPHTPDRSAKDLWMLSEYPGFDAAALIEAAGAPQVLTSVGKFETLRASLCGLVGVEFESRTDPLPDEHPDSDRWAALVPVLGPSAFELEFEVRIASQDAAGVAAALRWAADELRDTTKRAKVEAATGRPLTGAEWDDLVGCAEWVASVFACTERGPGTVVFG